MRTSQYLLATVKETPADAELISHRLMLRAGLIRKLGSGLYTWLPLGLKVLHKVTNIVRDEMDKAGALEVTMPCVQPAELWHESKRWEQYGSELLRFKDRHDRDFCFGPTHEEVITDIMRKEIRSYKQLPLNFYQINTKFRDEIRPRFGVMRAREFLMKDAYSFHIDAESLQQTYEIMYATYNNIFTRLGLNYRPVLADSGSIGGDFSHEFQVLAESGEDIVVYSDSSDYAANLEQASALLPTYQRQQSTNALTEVATPNQQSIAEVCAFLNVQTQQTVKTLLVKGADSPLIALVLRGDHEVNPLKAEKHTAIATPFTLASDEEVLQLAGCKPGSVGPLKLNIPVIADHSALALTDFICGANKEGFHLQNVNWERDCPEPESADLRQVVEGDPSPDGQGHLKFARGIEVGHIFQLGNKYSEAMNASVLDENGRHVNMEMGCYGIGVSRIVAAAIEQNHDERGIIWPTPMAPFQIALVPINLHKSLRLREACDNLYAQLQQAGFTVLYDDRNERPGVKFADMDLIGIPLRLVLSDKGLDAGTIECKNRREKDHQDIALAEVIDYVSKQLAQ